MSHHPLRFVLASPLPRDEIVRRLREAVDSSLMIFGKKPVVGGVSSRSFWLSVRITYRNSFQTVLFGRMSDDRGGGTRIECRAGMSVFTMVFMTIWFSFVGLAVVATPFAHARPEVIWPQLVPLLMLAFGVGLVAVGRWFARNEVDELVAFLEETIDASPIDSRTSGRES